MLLQVNVAKHIDLIAGYELMKAHAGLNGTVQSGDFLFHGPTTGVVLRSRAPLVAFRSFVSFEAIWAGPSR